MLVAWEAEMDTQASWSAPETGVHVTQLKSRCEVLGADTRRLNGAGGGAPNSVLMGEGAVQSLRKAPVLLGLRC